MKKVIIVFISGLLLLSFLLIDLDWKHHTYDTTHQMFGDNWKDIEEFFPGTGKNVNTYYNLDINLFVVDFDVSKKNIDLFLYRSTNLNKNQVSKRFFSMVDSFNRFFRLKKINYSNSTFYKKSGEKFENIIYIVSKDYNHITIVRY